MKRTKTLLTVILILFFFNSLQAKENFLPEDSLVSREIDLNEIIITASKDKSVLKKMPASVSLISNEIIESNEIKSLNEVSNLAANFVMPDYGSRLTSPVYIRGIGSRINSPSVGLYVDNIPYFEKAAFDFEFFELERIEVLRGPQGTLFGRNTMGGIINVLTLSPENYQGTNFHISAASYGNYKLSTSYYNKIKDKLAFSFSAQFNTGNGFYTNEFLNSKVDKYDGYTLRNKIIYNVNNKLTLENIANFDQSNQGGYPYAIFNDSLQKPENINYNQPSSYDRLIFSDGLKLNFKGNGWELNNTLSYQLLDDIQKIDQDFTPDSLYFVGQLMKQNMFSEELVVNSTNTQKYKWLFGVFGFMQYFDKSVDVNVYASKMWYLKSYDLQVSSYAFFHQSTYNITKNLAVTAGLRYDYELSKLSYQYNLERAGNPLRNTDTTYNSITDNVLLPKLALNYQFKNANLYVSYTTGYKPGGFNSTFERPEHIQFVHENSYNYEAGVKTSFFKHFIYADFAAFYTEIKNQQIYRTVPSGRGSYLDNAGVSENKGFEISLKNRQIKGLQGSLAYGYTHSKIMEYKKDSVTSYNNQFTPYIPRHTFAIQLSQILKTNNISFIDVIKFSTTYNQSGKIYWNLDNSYFEEAYSLLNAKVSFTKKHFQFDVWAKNILNTEYRSFLFEALGNTYVQMGKPFQLGMNLYVKF